MDIIDLDGSVVVRGRDGVAGGPARAAPGTTRCATQNALTVGGSYAPGAWVERLADHAPIVSRTDVRIRPATMDDIPAIDRMQKAESASLGFLPRMALVGKVKLGQVLVAERTWGVGDGGLGGGRQSPAADVGARSIADGVAGATALQSARGRGDGLGVAGATALQGGIVGYLIAADRYFKRDEVGYITQMNVLPDYRRTLVAGQLLQAQFDRSANGCKLYCCWCAQDLKANAFWEAMGFRAIAFRMGAAGKVKGKDGKREPRVHIFWQKRIRPGDDGDVSRGGTPWWYPSTTAGGQMRADRLVFPIPMDPDRPGELLDYKSVGPVSLGIDGSIFEPRKKTEIKKVKKKAKKVRAGGRKKKVKKVVKVMREQLVKVRIDVPVRFGIPGFNMPYRIEERKMMVEVEEEIEVDEIEVESMEETELMETAELMEQTELMEETGEVGDVGGEGLGVEGEVAEVEGEVAEVDRGLVELARALRDEWLERQAGIVREGVGRHDVKRVAEARVGLVGELAGELGARVARQLAA